MTLRHQLTYGILIWLCCLAGPSSAQEKPVLFADQTPWQIYERVHQAKWQVDVATVLACPSRRTGATEEQVYKRLLQERGTLAQAISLLKNKIQGGIATLVIKGKRSDRETKTRVTSRGTITMVKEDGTWRIRHEQWRPVGTEPDAGNRPASGIR